MDLSRHENVEKDFNALKRFAAPQFSLEAWERLFSLKGLKETPGIDSFPGFGSAKVYKGRVVPLKENVGKSKGYRVILNSRMNSVVASWFSRGMGFITTNKI